MDIVNSIQQKSEADQNQTVLVVTDRDTRQSLEEALKALSPKPNLTLDEQFDSKENSNDTVYLQIPETKITDSLLQKILKSCKQGSQLIITKLVKDVENVEFLLKTNGFTSVEVTKADADAHIIARKPKYDVGSSSKLNLKKPVAAVWKLDDDGGEEETIDPDVLLDDDDLKKPDPSSLRVCGTTGKRKACKDCSCGLADELASEAQSGKVVDTTDAPKSSCGSCYLGDAFRCASCPYLGMPAFKPGEKIQLSDNLLKADI